MRKGKNLKLIGMVFSETEKQIISHAFKGCFLSLFYNQLVNLIFFSRSVKNEDYEAQQNKI